MSEHREGELGLSRFVALLMTSVEGKGLEPDEARELRALHGSLRISIPLRSLMFLASGIKLCLSNETAQEEERFC